MQSEQDIRAKIAQHEENLALWREPNGFLIPTEPDPDARDRVRAELRAAILTLRWVLQEK